MENFSPELIRAQAEALEIQKRANEEKERQGETGSLTSSDYENSEKALRYSKLNESQKNAMAQIEAFIKDKGDFVSEKNLPQELEKLEVLIQKCEEIKKLVKLKDGESGEKFKILLFEIVEDFKSYEQISNTMKGECNELAASLDTILDQSKISRELFASLHDRILNDGSAMFAQLAGMLKTFLDRTNNLLRENPMLLMNMTFANNAESIARQTSTKVMYSTKSFFFNLDRMLRNIDIVVSENGGNVAYGDLSFRKTKAGKYLNDRGYYSAKNSDKSLAKEILDEAKEMQEPWEREFNKFEQL